MIVFGRVLCDGCRVYLGQLFVRSLTDFHLCDACWHASVVDDGTTLEGVTL